MSYTFPSCVHVDFPASDANSAHSPLAEFCVPCVPSGTETEKQPPQSQFPQNRQAPWLPPVGPVQPVSGPRWGNGPVPARSGAVWAPQGPSLAEVTGEAEKPFFVFCFSQAGNKTHRSLKPTHSSLLGRASKSACPTLSVGTKGGQVSPAGSVGSGAVPTGDPRPRTHFARKERSL